MKALVLAAALVLTAAPAMAQSAPSANPSPAQTVRIVVPVRSIARGEVLTAGDLAYAQLPPGRTFGGVILDIHELEGKQARRVLEANQPLRPSDVRAPVLVTKGSTVTMTFSAPGITLTAVGKAMSEGGLGETITVLNPASYRQISAIVTGPGAVVAAGPAAATTSATLSAASAQFAAANP